MSETSYADLPELAAHLRSVLAVRAERRPDKSPFILLYAFNGTGKTRLSTAFKDLGKVADENGEVQSRDTLYFNAFTEDLFSWDRRVGMDEIGANDFNLNIARYVSTADQEVAIDLSATHKELVEIEKQIHEATARPTRPSRSSSPRLSFSASPALPFLRRTLTISRSKANRLATGPQKTYSSAAYTSTPSPTRSRTAMSCASISTTTSLKVRTSSSLTSRLPSAKRS